MTAGVVTAGVVTPTVPHPPFPPQLLHAPKEGHSGHLGQTGGTTCVFKK